MRENVGEAFTPQPLLYLLQILAFTRSCQREGSLNSVVTKQTSPPLL
jgi:hypothetical protein